MDIGKHLKLLKTIFPAMKWIETDINNKQGLPFWISKAVNIVTFTIQMDQKIVLIFPVRQLEFDQLVNIQKQIQKRINVFAIIVADNQNSKYRSLFVREGIPFIYKDETIFAPTLGIKLFNNVVPDIKKNGGEICEELTSFDVKILAGYLTDFFTLDRYNLNDILKVLSDNYYKCSKGKVSKAIKNLLKKRFMESEGYGPNRTVNFINKAKTWQLLKEVPIAKSYRLVEGNYYLREKRIFSGETALAHYSDLSAPAVKTIAVTNKEFRTLELFGEVNTNQETYIEIRKEVPSLFSIESYLNPIELFLGLRKNQDDRIQISLGQMMKKWNLEVV